MLPVRVALARGLATGLSILALASACGSPPASGRLTGTLTVLAPTSMTDVLPKLVFAFETVHTGIHLNVSYGPDARQAAQPGDVLMVEGPSALGGKPGAPVAFARDQLVLVVTPTNPTHVIQLADLARPGVRVARCADTQPCGMATSTMLTGAGVTLAAPVVVDDVRAARALVEQGNADVALVYRSDALVVPDRVATIEVPESADAVATFQAVPLTPTDNAAGAHDFVAFLASGPAQDILTENGFQLP